MHLNKNLCQSGAANTSSLLIAEKRLQHPTVTDAAGVTCRKITRSFKQLGAAAALVEMKASTQGATLKERAS